MEIQRDSGIDSVAVRRARVDSLLLYEVTESELQELESGGSASVLLNFSILLFSTAAAFLIALLSTDIESNRTFMVFVVFTTVGFVGGFILFVIWWKARQTVGALVARIKSRMPSEDLVDADAQQQDAVDRQQQGS